MWLTWTVEVSAILGKVDGQIEESDISRVKTDRDRAYCCHRHYHYRCHGKTSLAG